MRTAAELVHCAESSYANVNGRVPTGVMQACKVRETRVRAVSEVRRNRCESGSTPGMTSAADRGGRDGRAGDLGDGELLGTGLLGQSGGCVRWNNVVDSRAGRQVIDWHTGMSTLRATSG
eukprot:4378041-Pleurochrysis_carterae.AAC.1